MGTELKTILSHNGVEIVADPDNLTSLTALWKAAGSDPSKQPRQWLRWTPTQEFLASLAENLKVGLHTLTKTRRGGQAPGTWAHWQVAMAYAKWLSPEFHQAVNEGFRRWFEEERNPGLKLERGVDKLLSQGYTPEWVKTRVEGIVTRKVLTGTMQDHNCRPVGSLNPFAEATRSITMAAVGVTPKEFRAENGLTKKSQATRDHMTARELTRLAFLESEAAAVIKEQASDGNEECLGSIKGVCEFGKQAFRSIEAIRRPARSA